MTLTEEVRKIKYFVQNVRWQAEICEEKAAGDRQE